MERNVEPLNSGRILARMDRISVWSLPYLFIGIIGVGFLFTFYDIFNINVSFIETCGAIVPGCTPVGAAHFIGLPVMMNLLGYLVGTLLLSPLADRFGRRDMLLVTMMITGLGSLWTAFSHDYSTFIWSRALTGVGVGADLAIVNTYINEVAPKEGRARYTALIFIMSGIGAFLGIWIGLWLTTPATPFPLGLPIAMAGPHFLNGWRLMYFVGAFLALVGVLLRVRMPESPRWLITRNRTEEAEHIVSHMEETARQKQTLRNPGADVEVIQAKKPLPYSEIFADPKYRKRTFLLLAMWSIGYVTVYSFAAGFTSLLVSLHYPVPEAGLIAAFGTVGMILSGVVAYGWGERLERKVWMLWSALLTLLGGFIIAEAGTILWLSMFGAIMVFFGFDLWVPIAYAWSTEHYPTRARASGFALVDGLGHLGGGVGVLLVVPFVSGLPVLGAFMIIGGFLAVSALVAQGGMSTRGIALDELSP